MARYEITIGWEAEKALCRRVGLDEWLSCKRKVRYGREATAVKACAAMLDKTGEQLEPYKCRHCDGWHIGHSRFS